jgi:hypothetical protein
MLSVFGLVSMSKLLTFTTSGMKIMPQDVPFAAPISFIITWQTCEAASLE